MPCGVVSQSSEHREKEQELKHVSPLSGLDTFAAEIETDPTANNSHCCTAIGRECPFS